jgi:hypothetical protein
MECLLMYLFYYLCGVATSFILVFMLNHIWLYKIHKNSNLSKILLLTVFSWIGVSIIIIELLMEVKTNS